MQNLHFMEKKNSEKWFILLFCKQNFPYLLNDPPNNWDEFVSLDDQVV